MNANPISCISSLDLQRAQALRWLKQISSFTAWNRILAQYRAWAAIAEKMAQVPHDAKPLGEQEWLDIQYGLTCCEQGVGRLRRGDKRGFIHPYGDFAQSSGPLRHWAKRLGVFGKRKDNFARDSGSHWSEFRQTLIPLVHVWDECSSTARAPSHPFEPKVFLDRLVPDRSRLAIYADLLPDATEGTPLTVLAGQKVPRSGVWEPVGRSGVAGSRTDLFYLAADSTAPAPDPSLAEAIHHWRLFWEDVRYKDGLLPLEEFAYFSGV